MHVGAIADNSRYVLLHIPAESLPLRASPAERRQEIKIGVLLCEALELFAIVDVLLAAHTEQQPELTILMARRIGEQPVQHRSKRRDPSSSRDENRIPQGRTQNESTEGTLKCDLCALPHVAKIVGHE